MDNGYHHGRWDQFLTIWLACAAYDLCYTHIAYIDNGEILEDPLTSDRKTSEDEDHIWALVKGYPAARKIR